MGHFSPFLTVFHGNSTGSTARQCSAPRSPLPALCHKGWGHAGIAVSCQVGHCFQVSQTSGILLQWLFEFFVLLLTLKEFPKRCTGALDTLQPGPVLLPLITTKACCHQIALQSVPLAIFLSSMSLKVPPL